MKHSLTIIIISLSFGLIGCGSSPKTETGAPNTPKFTHTKIKKEIRKGKTTQTELLHILGNPDTIYKNSSNKEVWTYHHQTFDPKSSMLSGGIIVYGMTESANQTAHTYNLLVEWNSKNIVKNFTVMNHDI
jgi:hypothetical protein